MLSRRKRSMEELRAFDISLHESDMLAASAVLQLVCFVLRLSFTSSRMHALTTTRSSSHSYRSYFCLSVNGLVSARGLVSKFSFGPMWKSFGRVSSVMLTLPVWRAGYRDGHAGMKNCFLSVPTSMTQSSYSMRCSKQGVVSKAGGILTGALMKPKNDILN